MANRLLPVAANVGSYGRTTLEMWVFYGVWLGTLAHAAARGRTAWGEQAWGIAALATAAVVLNWATTGQHLGVSLRQGLWAVAGMDALLLATAAIAWRAAVRLQGKLTPRTTQAPTRARSEGPHHA